MIHVRKMLPENNYKYTIIVSDAFPFLSRILVIPVLLVLSGDQYVLSIYLFLVDCELQT